MLCLAKSTQTAPILGRVLFSSENFAEEKKLI